MRRVEWTCDACRHVVFQSSSFDCKPGGWHWVTIGSDRVVCSECFDAIVAIVDHGMFRYHRGVGSVREPQEPHRPHEPQES